MPESISARDLLIVDSLNQYLSDPQAFGKADGLYVP